MNESGKNIFKRKWIIIALSIIIPLLAALIYVENSPRPMCLFYRWVFNKGGEEINEKLKKHVPPGIKAITDMVYEANDPIAKLDIYFPEDNEKNGKKLPCILWIHGGGLISGSKDQVANYCKILASNGFAVAAMDYGLAPEHIYPTPLRQTMQALDFLIRQAGALPIDTGLLFLAGDSGGGQLAAQTANLIEDSAYAVAVKVPASVPPGQIKGLLLFCGPYDIKGVELKGDFGGFMKTVLWAYSGSKAFARNPYFATAAIFDYLSPNFPPSFISVGNDDPLAEHSYLLAEKLISRGVEPDTLFFRNSSKVQLPHEYQFDFDAPSARLALQRSVSFINQIKNRHQAFKEERDKP